MAVIESSCRIERPSSVVFDTVADPRSELRWTPKGAVMEKLTNGPIGVGTRFRAKWTKSPLVELRITRWDRPRGWAYLNGGAIAVQLTVTLEDLDRGRRHDASEQVRGHASRPGATDLPGARCVPAA